MKVKLTLQRRSGPKTDIIVTADAVATVGAIAQTITRLDPLSDEPTAEGRTLAIVNPHDGSTQYLDAASHLSDSKLGSGAIVQTVPIASAARAQDASTVVAVLRVDAGPDRGREFQLRRGSVVIGRDAECDILLADPMVSKRHARIEVSDTVDVIDLNSANAIVVDGGVVTRVRLESGQTMVLGDTALRIEFVERAAAAVPVQQSVPVAFNRSPSVEPRYPGDEFDAPEVPKELDPIPFPWLAFAAPLVLVGVMFFVLENKTMLIFLALSPVIMIGTFFTQRLAQRAKLKKAIANFQARLDRLTETLDTEREKERQVRDAESPTAEVLVQGALGLGPSLWARRPEHWSFLNVRLGTGTVTSRNVIKATQRFGGLVEFQERLDSTIENYHTIPDVAIVESLSSAGCLGIAGDQGPATSTANAIIAQISALYSPAELAIAAIVSPQRSRDFNWIKWLPHAGSPQSLISTIHLADNAVSGVTVLTALEELIEERGKLKSGDGKKRKFTLGPVDPEKSIMGAAPDFGTDEKTDFRPDAPVLVVLICDDAPLDRARVNSIVERSVRAGILPIWVADTTAQLPAAARTFVDVSAGTQAAAKIGYVRLGMTFEGVTVSTLASAEAETFAKSLSAVSDASAVALDESDIPKSIALLSLLGHDMSESADAVIDRWRQNDSMHDRTPGAEPTPRRAGKLRALVGQASVDAMHLDLRAQGPHALVGGTTGSGKSEFLQAWVLGMAAEYSPDRVTFLFVDYKGGSAFAECVQLPHCVGLVTDLTPHLVRRALTSLRAELHFREHLLNRKKAKDLIELEKRGDPECPPALILVIDEFAALVGEIPEFVDGIVDVAQRGRSLGIHLIMATQRPAGVIKDNLRANTNLRIALRVADPADSTDVVGSRIAADFDPAIPGRAVAKSGAARLIGFQTGYAGGWTSNEPATPSIEISDLEFGLPTTWQDTSPRPDTEIGQTGPNDTSRLVTTMISAARKVALPEPRKPWLDELSGVYDGARLRQRTDSELVLGVVDDAKNQSQYPVYFRPDVDGNLAVYGAGGAGKSVALRTLATAAAVTPSGGPVQVYGLDFGSAGLRLLETLPHVGAVVDGDDSERVSRLLAMIRGIIDERTERFGAVRAGSIAEYRSISKNNDEPRILLLIDGAGAFRTQYEYTQGSVYSDFQQIIADGRSVGVHTVLSVDRPGSIPPAIASAMQRKIVLRLTEDNDYGALDAPSDVLSAGSAPGRALIDGMEAQLAIFGGSRNVSDQSRAIDRLAETLRERGVPQAPGVARLGDDIPLSTLPAAPAGLVTVGVADDDLAPVHIEPTGTFMLMGPPSSGRSTALAALSASVASAAKGVKTFYIGNAKSPLSTTGTWTAVATSLEDAVALAAKVKELAAKPASDSYRIAVFVEGLSDFLSTPADAALIDLFKVLKRGDHFVLGESETSTWSSSWPLLQELKSGRRGLALQPDQQEGDLLFRTSFPRAKRSEFPAGRGYLVQAGKVRRVQVARLG